MVAPNSDQHWVIPGAMRAAARIVLRGNARHLVAAELAVSSTTCTRLLASLPPWRPLKTLYVSTDPYRDVTDMRRLLTGRRETKTPDELRFIPVSDAMSWAALYTDLSDIIRADYFRLVIIDDAGQYNVKAMRACLQRWQQQGVTSVLVCADDLFKDARDGVLHAEKDDVQNIIYFGASTISMARATPHIEKDMITFSELPTADLSPVELEVWRALHHINHGSEADIRKELGHTAKQQKIVRSSLDSMLQKGVVKCEEKPMPMGNRTFKVWSTS